MVLILPNKKKDLSSHEAHLVVCVNKQNCRIWGSESPHVVLQKPMHLPRVTVWAVEGSVTITVNGDTYHTMITVFFIPTLHFIDVNDVWFQQIVQVATIDLLRQTFDY